MSVLYFQFLFA